MAFDGSARLCGTCGYAHKEGSDEMDYPQSIVDAIATLHRNAITSADGHPKRYTQAELDGIIDAIESNPKHRE